MQARRDHSNIRCLICLEDLLSCRASPPSHRCRVFLPNGAGSWTTVHHGPVLPSPYGPGHSPWEQSGLPRHTPLFASNHREAARLLRPTTTLRSSAAHSNLQCSRSMKFHPDSPTRSVLLSNRPRSKPFSPGSLRAMQNEHCDRAR